MPEIFIDADACPVKEEIYRVAKRYEYAVTLVSNAIMRIPQADWLKLVVVDGRLDAADDWIVARVVADDIVISGDIPLAARCLEKRAVVLDMRGGVFTDDRIGEALAGREVLGLLRERGTISGGPAPFTQKDRSRFLQRLDQEIQAIRRRR